MNLYLDLHFKFINLEQKSSFQVVIIITFILILLFHFKLINFLYLIYFL